MSRFLVLVAFIVAVTLATIASAAETTKARVIPGSVEVKARHHEHRILRDARRRLHVMDRSSEHQARVVTKASVEAESAKTPANHIVIRDLGSLRVMDLNAELRRQTDNPIDDNHHLLQAQRLGRYLNRRRAHVVRHPYPHKIDMENEQSQLVNDQPIDSPKQTPPAAPRSKPVKGYLAQAK